MKWQRARNTGQYPGLMFWVALGPPRVRHGGRSKDPVAGDWVSHDTEAEYPTNLVDDAGLEVSAYAPHTELLAEFAEDVPTQTVTDVVAAWRGDHEVRQ